MIFIFTDIESFPSAEIGFDVAPEFWNENVDTFEECSILSRLVEDWGGL